MRSKQGGLLACLQKRQSRQCLPGWSANCTGWVGVLLSRQHLPVRIQSMHALQTCAFTQLHHTYNAKGRMCLKGLLLCCWQRTQQTARLFFKTTTPDGLAVATHIWHSQWHMQPQDAAQQIKNHQTTRGHVTYSHCRAEPPGSAWRCQALEVHVQ